MGIIYLDNAATTPLCVEAKKEMIKAMDMYGNPSSIHSVGKEALKIVQLARKRVANLINTTPDRIFFTSGGTESDNWAIYGSVIATQKNKIITSPIEHHAIIRSIEKSGVEIIPAFVNVNSKGMVDEYSLKDTLDDNTALVSIMMANNEVGTIQNIKSLAQITRNKGILFHTDAVQAIGKINVDVESLGVDMLSLSAHKFNGPKGVGALYIKRGIDFSSLINGGRQEEDRRAGTHNVIGIAGMGAAANVYLNSEKNNFIDELTKQLEEGFISKIPDIKFNGHCMYKVPGILNVCFKGVESKRLVFELNKVGICISSGSACSEGLTEPSHVLAAMGIPIHEAHSSVRFSLSKYNNKEEINRVLEVLPSIIKQLRRGL